MKRAFLRVGLMAAVALGAADLCMAADPMEASMNLTGTIHLAADGHTQSYALDYQDKLPPEAIEIMQRTVPSWRFQPTLKDNVPVPVDARMFVKLVARPNGNGGYGVEVASANFDTQIAKAIHPGRVDKALPIYPSDAVRYRVSGDVYLIAHVGQDGHVTDVSAEQVNLVTTGRQFTPGQGRKLLADASIEAVKKWTFQPPVDARADQHSWIVRIPINFSLTEVGTSTNTIGGWTTYLPGPRESVPWLAKYRRPGDGLDSASDVVPEGDIYWAGAGLTLLNPSPRS